MELKKYKLGDIVETGSGGTPKSTVAEYYDNGIIPWINSGELNQPFIRNAKNYITKAGLNNSSAKLFPADTVLLAMYGATAGKASLLKFEATTNQAICAIIPNKQIVEPLFLKYKFDTMYDYLVGLSTGSARDNLSQIGIRNLKISLPELSTQRRISSILSTLDQKIALNRKINDNLEAMAKQLYDYWFVQFDFPNKEGKPYKSSGGKMVWNEKLKREIPEGWEVKKLGNIIQELESGKRPKGGIDKSLREGIPSLGAEAISKLGDFDYSKTPYIPFNTKINSGIIKNNDILVYKDGAYVGKTTLYRDNFPFEFATINEHVFLLRATESEMQEYIFFTLQKDYLFNIMQNLGKAKAAQPGLNQEDLKSIDILVPTKEIIHKYKQATEPSMAILFNKAKQTENLTKQRDELLPLLMNGQVSVN